jgi:D-proline reductase (dithiol) PrdB
MPRWWNQVQSKLYARVPRISERYGRRVGTFDEIPVPGLVPLRHPLSQVRVAVVTAGGVHLDSDAPFDMHDPEGDASFRPIPHGVPADRLRITHDYYDHAPADRDHNCILPSDRLDELVHGGVIGGVGPRHVGMMGHLSGTQLGLLVDRTAGEVADLFVEDRVDLVLAVPG